MRVRVGPLVRPANGAGALRTKLALASRDPILLAPFAVAAVAHLPVPSALEAVLAALLSVLVPAAIGYALLAVPARVLRRRPGGDAFGLAMAWTVGAWALLVVSTISSTAGLFDVGSLTDGAIWGTLAAWLVLRLADLRRWLVVESIGSPDTSGASAGDRRSALAMVAAAVVGLVLAVWYRFPSPAPYQVAWDALVHLRVVDGLLGGFFSLWTTDYSTAFHLNAYFPTQQLTVAIAAQMTGQSPLAVYWGGPFVVIPLFAVFAFTLVRVTAARPLAALVASSAAVVIGLPLPSMALLWLLPRSLAELALPLLLAAAVDPERSVTSRLVRVTVLSLGAFALHWVVGIAGLAFGVAAILLTVLERRWRGSWAPTLVAVGGVAALGSLLYTGVVHLPSGQLYAPAGVEGIVTIVSLAQRVQLYAGRLEWVAFALSGIGAVLLAVHRHGRVQYSVTLAFCWAGALVVAFLPLLGAERVLAVVPATFAPPLGWLIESALVWAHRGRAVRRGLLVGAALTLAGIIVAQPLLRVYQIQVRSARDAGFLSSFAPAEADAAWLIRHDMPGTTLIVSDPITQEVIGGLADRETYGGGPYASDEQLAALYDALTAGTAQGQWEGLWRAVKADGWQQGPVVLVVSGRTAAWLLKPDVWFVGYYQRLGPYLTANRDPVVTTTLSHLSNESFFERVWQEPGELEVFVLAPQPGDPIWRVAPFATPRAPITPDT